MATLPSRWSTSIGTVERSSITSSTRSQQWPSSRPLGGGQELFGEACPIAASSSALYNESRVDRGKPTHDSDGGAAMAFLVRAGTFVLALSLVAFFVTAVVLPPQDASVNINLGAGIAGMSFVAAASAIGSAKLAQRSTDSDFLRIVPALVSVLAMLAALAGLVLVGVFLFEEIR